MLFTSPTLQKKLVSSSAESRPALFKAILKGVWARMAPPIAPGTVLLAPDVAFIRYRNVTRVVGRWVHVLGTTRSEIFIHCQNRICFHNSSLHIEACGGGEKCTPQQLAFAVQKLRYRCSVQKRWQSSSTDSWRLRMQLGSDESDTFSSVRRRNSQIRSRKLKD
jgi:hypothetical protein